jgi:hypothetical protein
VYVSPRLNVFILTVPGLELAALHSKAVDYVKTGQPADMPRQLKPCKWPHFMEKKHKPKDAVYHSEKILGKLYDSVERVCFVPQWKEPFDKRILRAYKLDDAILRSARQIKRQYDAAMRRIMAQQEIETEFEVWSAFSLSRPRVGSDFKLQEVIAGISDALKDQFRMICIETAGGKDFSVLGPFAAAMYRITKDELDIALAECRSTKLIGGREVPKRKMEPEFMPLISFPWLFEKELGRIVTGIGTGCDLDELGLRSLMTKNESSTSCERQARREMEPKVPSNEFNTTAKGKYGGVITATTFKGAETYSSISGQSSEDTGVEDVTPRNELEVLVGRYQATELSHEEVLEEQISIEEHLEEEESPLEKLARLIETSYQDV